MSRRQCKQNLSYDAIDLCHALVDAIFITSVFRPHCFTDATEIEFAWM